MGSSYLASPPVTAFGLNLGALNGTVPAIAAASARNNTVAVLLTTSSQASPLTPTAPAGWTAFGGGQLANSGPGVGSYYRLLPTPTAFSPSISYTGTNAFSVVDYAQILLIFNSDGIAPVWNYLNSSTAGPGTRTFSVNNPAAGQQMMVVLQSWLDNPTYTFYGNLEYAITDSAGNTYTKLADVSTTQTTSPTAGAQEAVWMCPNPVLPISSVTATLLSPNPPFNDIDNSFSAFGVSNLAFITTGGVYFIIT